MKMDATFIKKLIEKKSSLFCNDFFYFFKIQFSHFSNNKNTIYLSSTTYKQNVSFLQKVIKVLIFLKIHLFVLAL